MKPGKNEQLFFFFFFVLQDQDGAQTYFSRKRGCRLNSEVACRHFVTACTLCMYLLSPPALFLMCVFVYAIKGESEYRHFQRH